ncbi:MAG: TM2 domain-containing protein [Bacteroidota bacterium]
MTFRNFNACKYLLLILSLLTGFSACHRHHYQAHFPGKKYGLHGASVRTQPSSPGALCTEPVIDPGIAVNAKPAGSIRHSDSNKKSRYANVGKAGIAAGALTASIKGRSSKSAESALKGLRTSVLTASLNSLKLAYYKKGDKNKGLTILIAFPFLTGLLGVYYFYLGYHKKGWLWLGITALTFIVGVLAETGDPFAITAVVLLVLTMMIRCLIDFVKILSNNLTPAHGDYYH